MTTRDENIRAKAEEAARAIRKYEITDTTVELRLTEFFDALAADPAQEEFGDWCKVVSFSDPPQRCWRRHGHDGGHAFRLGTPFGEPQDKPAQEEATGELPPIGTVFDDGNDTGTVRDRKIVRHTGKSAFCEDGGQFWAESWAACVRGGTIKNIRYPSAAPVAQAQCSTCHGDRTVHVEGQIGVHGSGGDIPCPDCTDRRPDPCRSPAPPPERPWKAGDRAWVAVTVETLDTDGDVWATLDGAGSPKCWPGKRLHRSPAPDASEAAEAIRQHEEIADALRAAGCPAANSRADAIRGLARDRDRLRAQLDAVTKDLATERAAREAAEARVKEAERAADRLGWNRFRTAARAAIQARINTHQAGIHDNGRCITDRADSARAMTEAIQCRIVADMDYPGPVSP